MDEIPRHYNNDSHARMYKYQDDAVNWMKSRELDADTPGGFLCHEMGLGKTRIMCRLIKSRRVPFTLVLTTKSTTESWLAELRRQSQFAFDVVPFDLEFVPSRDTVMVGTHHSVLKKVVPWAVSRIVVDEIHMLRSMKQLFWCIARIPARVHWGITATPYNNGSRDIRAYTEFLKPGLPADEFGKYMIRKTRADVMPDGPKLEMTKYVYDFETDEEKRLYDYVAGRIDDANDWIVANARRLPFHVRGVMMATLSLRKRQAAIHPQIVLDVERVWRAQMPPLPGAADVEVWDPEKVTKFKHILKLVKEDRAGGRSTMIVTHFQTEMTLLQDMLVKAKIRCHVLNGKTKAKDRAALETLGNSGATNLEIASLLDQTTFLPDEIIDHILGYVDSPKVLLLQIRAGGVGLSLPWVHHVINTSPDWNPFMELQAVYRAYRATTRHNVKVTSLYFRNTIDTDIQERQAEKFTNSLKWTGDAEESISEFISMPV